MTIGAVSIVLSSIDTNFPGEMTYPIAPEAPVIRPVDDTGRTAGEVTFVRTTFAPLVRVPLLKLESNSRESVVLNIGRNGEPLVANLVVTSPEETVEAVTAGGATPKKQLP